jgi:hypothetical protein
LCVASSVYLAVASVETTTTLDHHLYIYTTQVACKLVARSPRTSQDLPVHPPELTLMVYQSQSSPSPLPTPVPRIEISPAPHKAKSPSTSPTREDPGTSRSKYLSPPPRHSPNEVATARLVAQQQKALAGSLRGQGLERIRFENLLRASKERKALLCNTKKAAELRKEVANIVQRNKQGQSII